MFRHEWRDCISNQGMEVRSLIDDFKIVKVRKRLDSGCLMWGKHPAAVRMGEPSSAVTPKSCGEGRSRFVPSHPTIDRGIGMVTLLARRPVLVRKIVFVLSNEPIHSLLVDVIGFRCLIEDGIFAVFGIEVANGPLEVSWLFVSRGSNVSK